MHVYPLLFVTYRNLFGQVKGSNGYDVLKGSSCNGSNASMWETMGGVCVVWPQGGSSKIIFLEREYGTSLDVLLLKTQTSYDTSSWITFVHGFCRCLFGYDDLS